MYLRFTAYPPVTFIYMSIDIHVYQLMHRNIRMCICVTKKNQNDFSCTRLKKATFPPLICISPAASRLLQLSLCCVYVHV